MLTAMMAGGIILEYYRKRNLRRPTACQAQAFESATLGAAGTDVKSNLCMGFTE
jgi:hypothetical protein